VKFRKPKKITHRISSVTNGFVQAILPVMIPTTEEENAVLQQLGMTRETMECVYCGGDPTDWDHLRPLVKGRRPTNNLTDFHNLVPACGPCNQSKGGQDWKSWMQGAAQGAPTSRGGQ
jgi:endonuclease I